MSEPDNASGAAREAAPAATSVRPSAALFREEALSHHFRAGWEGDVLRLPPAWTRWTYPLLLALTAAAALLLTMGSVRQYASGPAVVRIEGASSRARFDVVALLPGTSLLNLRPGQRMRVFLDAAPRSPLEATLATAPRQVVGPAEARRALPPAVADVPSIDGPVVIAAVEIPDAAKPGGPALELREGMTGRAEVEVGSERLLFALIPALKATGDR